MPVSTRSQRINNVVAGVSNSLIFEPTAYTLGIPVWDSAPRR